MSKVIDLLKSRKSQWPLSGERNDFDNAWYELMTEWVNKPKQLAKKDWALLNQVVNAIFTQYPYAYIYQLWTECEGVDILVAFRAMGGDGSDDVHIDTKGNWSQWMSGDLNMIELDKLESKIKRIVRKARKEEVSHVPDTE